MDPLEKNESTILIVDDNQDGADSLCQLLRLHDFDAKSVYNGTDAINFARQHNPKFIILDIGLPDVSGYEVAKAIKTKQNILIAVSGWGSKEHQDMSYAAGIDLHLLKPADPDMLLNIISIGLTKRSKCHDPLDSRSGT